jgi:hypothetical protein
LGLLRQWQALESWAVAGKLGVLRALIREDGQPLPGDGFHDDLPDGWTRSLTHEVALALAMPPQSADKLMWTAWDLLARLPRTGALLAEGALTYAKARAVSEALALLTDEDAAEAEAMTAPDLAGKTYGQVEKAALQAAITVDPDSATRRREDAERNRARITLRRDPSGAASLAGYDLPTDETLAAHANVCGRAQEYKESGAFPGVRMDQFRAMAYLDLMNGITADSRIACGQPPSGLGAPNNDGDDGPASAPDDGGPGSDPNGGDPASAPDDGGPGSDPDEDDPGSDPNGRGPGSDPDDGGPAGDGPTGDGPGGGGSTASPGSQPSSPLCPPRITDLAIPLSTLLGLARRPGEGHGLGPLDPDLCRSLAATAANSPHSTLCITITDADGFAVGHGCARPDRKARPGHGDQAEQPVPPGPPGPSSPPAPPSPPGHLAALPARVNLTIASERLAELVTQAELATQEVRPPGAWSFTRATDPGRPCGYGTWELTLPGGRTRTVRLEPLPTLECDHRHESHAYQPNDTLRHEVQVRDYECTFPTCSRHARESDFEHAVPYDKGGRTCGCNAGARSRRCHQVKQSPGWNVTQPRPGWHQWQTPSGRTYTQGPKRYPA